MIPCEVLVDIKKRIDFNWLSFITDKRALDTKYIFGFIFIDLNIIDG